MTTLMQHPLTHLWIQLPRGMRFVRTDGDGNCFYYTLILHHKETPETWPWEDIAINDTLENQADQLRSKLAVFIKANMSRDVLDIVRVAHYPGASTGWPSPLLHCVPCRLNTVPWPVT